MVRAFPLVLCLACTTAAGAPTPAPTLSAAPSAPAVVSVAPLVPASPGPPLESLPISAYPWGPAADDGRLITRFAAPPTGFARVATAPESFGRFLRALPLKPEGALVVDYRGLPLHAGGRHPNIVAVADLDVGTKDLQHCADVIIRLHAEWRYGKGERNLAYRSVSGQTLAYEGYLGGDRAVVSGKEMVFKHVAGAQKDRHPVMRSWLDEVFAWAGTASLEPYARKVAWADLAPGDFFVMSGAPFGHAVLVLDVAKDDQGRVALLVGQSYMPAQSFQILRPAGDNHGARDTAWFVVEPSDLLVDTPFWPAFPKTSLRRL